MYKKLFVILFIILFLPTLFTISNNYIGSIKATPITLDNNWQYFGYYYCGGNGNNATIVNLGSTNLAIQHFGSNEASYGSNIAFIYQNYNLGTECSLSFEYVYAGSTVHLYFDINNYTQTTHTLIYNQPSGLEDTTVYLNCTNNKITVQVAGYSIYTYTGLTVTSFNHIREYTTSSYSIINAQVYTYNNLYNGYLFVAGSTWDSKTGSVYLIDLTSSAYTPTGIYEDFFVLPTDHVSYNAVVPSGCRFANWTLSNGTAIYSQSFADSTPLYGMAIAYIFPPIDHMYNITSSADSGSYITPSGLNYYANYSSQTFNFWALSNYQLGALFINNTLTNYTSSINGNHVVGIYTFSNITGNSTIGISSVYVPTARVTIAQSSGGIVKVSYNDIIYGLQTFAVGTWDIPIGSVITMSNTPNYGVYFVNYEIIQSGGNVFNTTNPNFSAILNGDVIITGYFSTSNNGGNGNINSIPSIIGSIFGNIYNDIVFIIFGVVCGLLTWKFAFTGLVAGIGLSTFLCAMAGLLSIWAVALCVIVDITIIVLGSGLLNKTGNTEIKK